MRTRRRSASSATLFDLDHFPRRLIRGLSSNHPDMPEFKFSPQDARDLRDYLRTISGIGVTGRS